MDRRGYTNFSTLPRQVVRQDPVPKLGLRAGNDVVCLGQLLKIVGPAEHWVVIDLLIPDLHHVHDNLRILRVILVPTVVQGFAGAGQRH